MCSSIIYVYSCYHRERIVFRCRRSPANASQEQINACLEREGRARVNWNTTLAEPCHDCAQAMRERRRNTRRQTSAIPSAMVAALHEQRTIASNVIRAQPVRLAEDHSEMENETIRGMESLTITAQDNQGQGQGEGQGHMLRNDGHDFRAHDRPWMARIPQRRPEGVIRPLETNHLENIGRLRWEFPAELTPTQIWRFIR